MDDQQTFDPRRRIRELLAIPDRDRTDEQWDELNELEIRTAPGNREMKPSPDWRPPVPGRRPPGVKNTMPRATTEPRSSPEGKIRPEGRLLKRQHRRPKPRIVEPSGES